MKISIIMPVYNERNTIEEIIQKVQSVKIEKELIIVDDGSTDGTREFLEGLKVENIRILFHERNTGKGSAIRTAQSYVNGDIVIIQDADLEYYPDEYPQLVKPIVEGKADAVFGSRFLGTHRVFYFWHYMGNLFLNFVTNLLYNSTLTDMETGFKAIKSEIFKKIQIDSNRFDFEPEITAKILRLKCRLYETPISYAGRGYEEGKKITWKDGISALYALIKFRLKRSL